MLGDRPLMVGLGVRSNIEGSNSYDPFSQIGEYLKSFDIVFGNLESVISDNGMKGNDYKSIQMRGPGKSINSLINAGFNVLSIANNHIMQHGEGAFLETIDALDNSNIDALGRVDSNGMSLPIYKDIKGTIIAFIGFSMMPEKYNLNTKYAISEFKDILSSVKKLKKECDILIVSLHWGDEYISRPSQEQIMQARLLADSGASLLLGHHPHVLQGIEKYKSSLIAYSLGNFVFDVWQKQLRQSCILVVTIKNYQISDYVRIPVYIDDKFRPNIAYNGTTDRLKNRFSELDKMIDDLPVFDNYSKFVRLHEIRNKIENRLLFLRNIFKYQPYVLRQSLLGFIDDRMK